MTSEPSTNASAMARAAARLAHDSQFMASALRIWDQGDELNIDNIARRLDCGAESVVLLALCQRPRVSSFQIDCKQIAAETGLHVSIVANLARHADACEALGHAENGQLLAAARDHVVHPKDPAG